MPVQPGPLLTPADLSRLKLEELKDVAVSYGADCAPWDDRDDITKKICDAATLKGDPARAFTALASSLSDRLVALEKYLSSRPATVRAQVQFESEERVHRLQWSRHGGTWRLWVWDVPTEDEVEAARDENEGGTLSGINGRFLSQCTVDIKLAAAEAVPALLATIKAGELKTLDRLKAAHAKLDEVAVKWPEGA